MSDSMRFRGQVRRLVVRAATLALVTALGSVGGAAAMASTTPTPIFTTITAPAVDIASATTRTPIFTIGVLDNSAAEFALAPNNFAQYSARFPNDVHYTVGTSTPGQDWPYVQPGPIDAWAGSKVHPFTVTYQLAALPDADPTLSIRYVDTNNSIYKPTVQVLSNGTLVQTVPLPGGGGGGVFGQPGTPYTLAVKLPVQALKTGTNTLTIQNSQGSWSVFDAVQLTPPLPPGTPPDVSILSATPTVLFANDAGSPQIVAVSVVNSGGSGQVTFTADTAGSTITTTLSVPEGASTQQIEVVPAPSPGPASLTITSSAGGSTQLQLTYQRRWQQLYVIHGSHQDIGYTAIQPTVRQSQDQYLDTAVEECQATANYPADSKFHWTIEHAWMLENYVQDRSAAQVQALGACLKSGQFELAGTYDNQLYDLSSGEQMARALYPGTRTLADRFGVHPTSAIQDDVTGVTWQAIQMMSKAGIKYLMNGANPTRAPRPENTPALFWWKAPNESKVLTWYSGPSSYVEGYSLGLNRPASDLQAVAGSVSGRLSELQGQGYPRDIYPIQMLMDNWTPVSTLPDLARAWNEKYSYPKLVLSTPTPFFQAIEQEDPSSIPTHSGDWSDWWSDGAASSAHETAQVRTAQTRTTAAETLGALSSLTTPTDGSRQTQLDGAYQQAELYTEHTWGGATPSWTDPEWPYKQDFAIQADQLSQKALTSAKADLAARMQNSSPWPEVAVYNSLSWSRSGVVQETVPEGALDGRPFHLVDSDGNVVPYELVSRGGGKITLRFVARDVPSVGYRTYTLAPSTETNGQPVAGADAALHATEQRLSNQYFDITLNPTTGTISSIYDKARGKELVDAGSPFQANQFVYRPNCAGANKGNSCRTSDARQWSATQATVKVLSSGPVSATLEVTADPGAGGPTTGISGLTQRITLYAGIPEVYISDTVNKVRVDTAEEAYFAFPFKVDQPQVTYEVPDASVRFFTDQLPGSALDWQGIQSYADVSNSQGGVTFSSPEAPLVEFDHIRTGEFLTRPGHLDGTSDPVDPSSYLPKNGSIFPYAYNNLWFTNYRIAQQGPTTFNYGIASHAGSFDAVGESKVGTGYQTPLEAVPVPGRQEGEYNPGSHSLVSVDQPNVLIQTVKQAYGRVPGLTVRLLEVAGQSGTATIHLPFSVGSATLDDLTERAVSPLTTHGKLVEVPVEAHGVVTLTVVPQLALTATTPETTLVRGHTVPVTVTLVNNSHQVLSGSLALAPSSGLTVSPSSFPFANVAPGESATAVFQVTAPASTATGPVTLTASADLLGGQQVTPTQLTLDVANPIDLVASPSEPDLVENMAAPITVTATNNLNETTAATVKLAAPVGWTVQPPSVDLSLSAGQSKTVTFSVTPPTGSFGSHTLQVSADGGGATTAVNLPSTISRPIAVVGQRDQSSSEFALSPNHYAQYPTRFPNDVDFTFGTSDPATDWSYIQPGPIDGWAGSRTHTFTFRFDLPQAPTSDLSFTAWLLDTSDVYAPTLNIRLNGGPGQSVPLPSGGGDGYHWGDGQPNVYAGIQPTSFRVTLPVAQLHAGANAVTITDSSGSWIVYDAFGVIQRPN